MMHARVHGPYVGENKRESGDKSSLGWECKEPNAIRETINYTEQELGSPRPGLFDWAEDVIAKGLTANKPPTW
jgi:hypothetical protein